MNVMTNREIAYNAMLDKEPATPGLKSFLALRLKPQELSRDQLHPGEIVDHFDQTYPSLNKGSGYVGRVLSTLREDNSMSPGFLDKATPLGVLAIMAAVPAVLITGLSAVSLGLGAVGAATVGAAFLSGHRDTQLQEARNALESHVMESAKQFMTPGSEEGTVVDRMYPAGKDGIKSLQVVRDAKLHGVEEVALVLDTPQPVALTTDGHRVQLQAGSQELDMPGALSFPRWENPGTFTLESRDVTSLREAKKFLETGGVHVGEVDAYDGVMHFRANGPVEPSHHKQDYQDMMDEWYDSVTTR